MLSLSLFRHPLTAIELWSACRLSPFSTNPARRLSLASMILCLVSPEDPCPKPSASGLKTSGRSFSRKAQLCCASALVASQALATSAPSLDPLVRSGAHLFTSIPSSPTKCARLVQMPWGPAKEGTHSSTVPKKAADERELWHLIPSPQMCPQIACIRGCKCTLVAFVQLFSAVDFQMSCQSACIRGCKVTLFAFG